MSRTPVWVDTDNALGSSFGDIDDAVAILALARSGYPVIAYSSVFGNTFEPTGFKNTQYLLKLLGTNAPHYSGAAHWWTKGSEAATKLAAIDRPVRILALGPLTNISCALKLNPQLRRHIEEIIVVGTNFGMNLPTLRFFDFNISKDRASAQFIFDSGIPVTLVPCNQARKVRMCETDLAHVPGELGEFLRKNSKRWFRRARMLKFQSSIPVWDLLAAMYVCAPEEFKLLPVVVERSIFGNLRLRENSLSHIQCVTKFNTKLCARVL